VPPFASSTATSSPAAGLTSSARRGLLRLRLRRRSADEGRHLHPHLDRRGHQPYSLEAQAKRLGAYAESQEGWRITRRFTDQLAGAILERPGLERALAEAEAKRFDLLLVYRVDRLSRSVRGLAQILERLDQAGVLFRTATEPFDTSTSAGRMTVQMLGVFAEFERATITDRAIAGMERKAARGEWTGGSLPFGYRLAAERRFLVPDPTEAPLVVEVFRRYAERLEGSASIAKWLTDRGYRTKRGKPFNVPAVLTILRNRAYVGEVYFRGRRYPAPHEALVDVALFERSGEILRERGDDASLRRSNKSDYLLTGLVKCARCGKRYVGAAATATAAATPTTSASRASATARRRATAIGSRPRSSRRRSWASSSASSPRRTSCARRSPRPSQSSTPSVHAARPSFSESTLNSGGPTTRSGAPSPPSRPERWPSGTAPAASPSCPRGFAASTPAARSSPLTRARRPSRSAKTSCGRRARTSAR